ncbi:VCBS repeat-containing protein [candidate division KSB1 bacterium]|nr:VCBS repeat-containing protein [candidate division KSB1 bacterium]
MFQKYTLKICRDFVLLLFIALLNFIYPFSIHAQNKNQPTLKLPQFTDVSKSAGVDLDLTSFFATWADYDGDGWLDLFVCNGRNQQNALYHNPGNGTFEDVTETVGLISHFWTWEARWIDFDNDGDPDLYLKNASLPQLFENKNGTKFKDISRAFNFPPRSTASWADFNNDGWLDYYISRSDTDKEQANSPPNLLYKNLQNGSFEEIANTAGVAGENDSGGAYWIDYNNDGFVDLFVVNSYQQPNKLYRNNGNETFTNVIAQSGLKNYPGGWHWTDFNNDGWIDVFMNYGVQNMLYKNLGDGTFADVTLSSGIKFLPGYNHNQNFIDINNDGLLDFAILCNPIQPFQPSLPPRFIIYLNKSDETFSNFSEVNIDDSKKIYYNQTWGDYDNDGDMDVYIGTKEKNILLRNEGNSNNWLKINLFATQSNRDAIGAKVKVNCGSLKQIRQVGLGNPYNLYSKYSLCFGLGEHEIVDNITIQWPSGARQDTFNIKANQTIILTEPGLPMFTDITAMTGLAPNSNKSFGVACVDFNNDSLIDIYFSNHENRNEFYKNIGFSSFELITENTALDYSFWTAIGYGDFNNDGFGDVYACHAVIGTNLLFQNVGNFKFLNISKVSATSGLPNHSNDIALGDYSITSQIFVFCAKEFLTQIN